MIVIEQARRCGKTLKARAESSVWMAKWQIRDVRRMRAADGYTPADIAIGLAHAAVHRAFAKMYFNQMRGEPT